MEKKSQTVAKRKIKRCESLAQKGDNNKILSGKKQKKNGPEGPKRSGRLFSRSFPKDFWKGEKKERGGDTDGAKISNGLSQKHRRNGIGILQ